VIEQSYDPSFDPRNPNDLPQSCIIPGEGGLLCGADPQEIHDLKARAAYVAALRENEAKRQRASYYVTLNHIDDDAMASLELTLKFLRIIAHKEIPPDAAALEDILQKAGLSDSRCKELDSYISPTCP
jgi:hypothetical protein